MVKQDYLMRLIHEMVRTIIKLIFNIDEKTGEFYEPGVRMEEGGICQTVDIEQELKETSDLYIRLVRLADAGKINEAENLLYEQLENGQAEDLKAALGFYDHLNDYTEEFLDKADFSREEIKSGLVSVLRMYGYEGMTGLLMQMERSNSRLEN